MGDWILITSEDLPTLPHVAARILSLVGNPASSAKDLQGVIETDQALTERLLRMSNSSLFGGATKITSIRAAVARLGFNRVRNLVLIASTKDVYRTGNKTAQELWRHSLGVGLASRMVGESLGIGSNHLDDLFLAGLFHDIGKVLMNNQKPERYLEVIQRALDQRRATSEVEKEVFKFSHEEVGVMILQKWGLPDCLVNPVRCHHMIQREDCPELPDQRQTAIVATADLIANMLGMGLLTSANIDPVGARSSRLLGLGEEKILAIIERLPDSFLAQMESFNLR